MALKRHKYTKEVQARATAKYMEDKISLRVTVTKEKADAYKKFAEEHGMSFTGFAIGCMDREIERITAEEKSDADKEMNSEKM